MRPSNLFCLIFFSSFFSYAENNLHELEKNLNQVVEKKSLIDLQLIKLQDDISRLETDIRNKRKILIQRTRALGFLKDFKWGGLLAAEDPGAFERNLAIMNRLNKYDVQLFKEYRSSLKKLVLIRKDLKSKQVDFDKIVSDFKLQEIELLKTEDLTIQKNLTENKNSLLTAKGRLAIPIHRPVSQSYGSKRDSSNQYALLVRGLIFDSQLGDSISAVGPGKVIFSDHIPHWGDAIIVQHPDNYYSIYAGLNNVKKSVESYVSKNDLIANAGLKSFYFELRHFDEPINPKKWFESKLVIKEVK